MADCAAAPLHRCAAAPLLFYAFTVVEFPACDAHLAACFERLMHRPSVARALAGARPYFRLCPLHDAIPTRFLGPTAV